ncbi:MAG: transglycosylase SLT domain-containing protein [Syntrophorhabdales bacterium]|jgi:membrane-bound lytic murein transglycosylase D
MDETGRQYGLRVDYWVDERYDLEKSTVAAARYLKKLFDQFGCWYLVAASYNAGENKVKKAIESSRTQDFWELREYNMLPRETQEYVPQLIAAAVIAKDPERYGFTGIGSTAVYRLTKMNVPGGVPLREVAHVLSIDLAELKALNPELLQGITPPDRKRYQIKLPGTEEAEIAARKVEGSLRWERRVVQVLQHHVTAKDSVTGIERLYNVTRPGLSLVNAEGLRMEKGRILYIPRFAGGSKDTPSPRAFRPRLAVARGIATDQGPKHLSKPLTAPSRNSSG